MFEATIDLGDDTTSTVAEQHHLLSRLQQLAEAHDHNGWADDHVVNQLLRRYERYRSEQARFTA